MNKGKSGPASIFHPLWESEIPELLRQDHAGRLSNSGVLDALMQRHPQQFAGHKRDNLLRTLGRQIGNGRSVLRCLASSR